MTWAESKLEELALKGKENWDNEAYCYCEECMAENARDAEYLGNFEMLY